MQNLKIRVNSADESKEAQELFFKLGGSWSGYKNIQTWSDIGQLYLENDCIKFGGDAEYFEKCTELKEITLPELRAMVNPMKEYLMPSRNYEYILTDAREGLEPHAKDWVEIPEWANYAYNNDQGVCFLKSEIGYNHPLLIWQREQDEPFLTPECTLNDQYAEIEQVRQVEIHGTVKAEPDLNFGAAQASGGANMRENKHYFIDVSDVDEVDFYEIAKRYNVTDPAIQHILKKCLAIGNRGHKDLETDLKDILKTAKRALQINGFGE